VVQWHLTYRVQVIFPTFWNDKREITHVEPVLSATGAHSESEYEGRKREERGREGKDRGFRYLGKSVKEEAYLLRILFAFAYNENSAIVVQGVTHGSCLIRPGVSPNNTPLPSQRVHALPGAQLNCSFHCLNRIQG